MDRVIAYKLLSTELASYRVRPFDQLVPLAGQSQSTIIHQNGVDYDLTTTVRLLDENCVRVHVVIREANWGSSHDILEDEISVPQSTKT